MCDSIPVSRSHLIEFTNEIEEQNPGIKFDYSSLNKLKHELLWFLEII